MELVYAINKFLGAAVVAAQIFIVAILVVLAGSRRWPEIPFFNFLARKGAELALATVSLALAFSLVYSNLIGFPPCSLCWVQRGFFALIFIFLLGFFLARRREIILRSTLAASVLGGVVALYHNYIYYTQSSSALCSAAEAIACARRYVFEFDYIGIPMMSLTAFILIGLFISLNLRLKKRTQAKLG